MEKHWQRFAEGFGQAAARFFNHQSANRCRFPAPRVPQEYKPLAAISYLSSLSDPCFAVGACHKLNESPLIVDRDVRPLFLLFDLKINVLQYSASGLELDDQVDQ